MMTGTSTRRAVIASLRELRAAEADCRRCPLYRHATQVVPGEGPRQAPLMLVGEQPGDQEDRAGHPFVGPAGKLLDRAIAAAGLDRQTVFVTNAVKHFKFEPRGKRRLHRRPNAHEIDRCKWWNDIERALVRPRLIVALGATAARSLLGRPATIARLRGRPWTLDDGTCLVVTTHPSALLRMPDAAARTAAFDRFVADLRICAGILSESRRPAGSRRTRTVVKPAPVKTE